MKANPRFLLATFALMIASLACGLFGGGAPEPTQPPANVTLGDEVRSEEGGFALKQIPGYTVESLFGILTMKAPDGDENSGPVIMVIGSLNDEESSLDDEFNKMKAEMTDPEGGEITVSEPRDFTLAGAPARTVDVNGTNEDGAPMAGRVTIALFAPNQTFTMIGIATAERWESELAAYYEAVLDTVTLFESAPLDFGFIPEEIRQWAISATASSQYGAEGWAATQATGAPDVYPECGDYQQAWASANSNTEEWLEVTFATPVLASEINIYQTYNPGQIARVEALDVNGAYLEVYSASPQAQEECPSILTIYPSLAEPVLGLRISIDQSIAASWGEIDAVELVGTTTADSPVAAPPDTGGGEADPTPHPAGGDPDNFLWRIGGESGSEYGQFYATGGMDSDAAGRFYVSDDLHGVYMLDSQGNILSLFEDDDMDNAADVKLGPDGNLYVAAWGSNEVVVFKSDGSVVTRWGEKGNGQGQFGTFSPQALAIGKDGAVYVLDDNEDASGNDFTRVQIFSPQGQYQGEFLITEEFFSANAMDVGTDGNLYVLGFMGDSILQYDPAGNLLGKLGEETLDFTGPQGMFIDDAGNFYVSVWTPQSVFVLDPQGNKVRQIGFEWDDNTNPPLGSLRSTQGVAASPDGSIILVGDWAGDYAFISAFENR